MIHRAATTVIGVLNYTSNFGKQLFNEGLEGRHVLFSILKLDRNRGFAGNQISIDFRQISQSYEEKGLGLFSVRGNGLYVLRTDQIPDDCTCSRAMSHNQ